MTTTRNPLNRVQTTGARPLMAYAQNRAHSTKVETIAPADLSAVIGSTLTLEDTRHGPAIVPEARTVLLDGSPIGVVGTKYRPLQPSTVASCIGRIVDAHPGTSIVSASQCRGGRLAIVEVDLGQPIALPGKNGKADTVSPTWTVLDPRCGDGSLASGIGGFRMFCLNQVRALTRKLSESGGARRHTGDVGGWFQALTNSIDHALAEASGYADRIQTLADTTVTPARAREYLAEVFGPDPLADPEASGRARESARRRAVALSTRIGREARALGQPADSAWLLYNAVTGWAQHDRTVKSTTDPIADVWTGPAARISEDAWRHADLLLA